MEKDTTNRLNTLTEESTDVLEEAVGEASPLAEQEDTELRDLEEATRAATKGLILSMSV